MRPPGDWQSPAPTEGTRAEGESGLPPAVTVRLRSDDDLFHHQGARGPRRPVFVDRPPRVPVLPHPPGRSACFQGLRG